VHREVDVEGVRGIALPPGVDSIAATVAATDLDD
jgi:hypothetical protein